MVYWFVLGSPDRPARTCQNIERQRAWEREERQWDSLKRERQRERERERARERERVRAKGRKGNFHQPYLLCSYFLVECWCCNCFLLVVPLISERLLLGVVICDQHVVITHILLLFLLHQVKNLPLCRPVRPDYEEEVAELLFGGRIITIWH